MQEINIPGYFVCTFYLYLSIQHCNVYLKLLLSTILWKDFTWVWLNLPVFLLRRSSLDTKQQPTEEAFVGVTKERDVPCGCSISSFSSKRTYLYVLRNLISREWRLTKVRPWIMLSVVYWAFPEIYLHCDTSRCVSGW